MQPTCRFEILEPDARRTLLRISYQTPEWLRVTAALAQTLRNIIWLAGTFVAAAALYYGALDLTAAESIVAAFIASSAFYWCGWNTQQFILRQWERGRGIRALIEIGIGPKGVLRNLAGDVTVFSRTTEFVFTCAQHREGRTEQRDEQRIGHTLGFAYRDAWEVWLQAGHAFEPLAAVADEASARAVVRHLQDANDRATRTINAAERLHDRSQPA